MAQTVTVNDLLDGHVQLDIECLDRVYLNGYVPNLQVGGQVVSFLTGYLGYPISSPAIFAKLGDSFRRAVATFAAEHQIPVVRFGKGDRKIEVVRPYLRAQAAAGRSGVAAIGVAQEFQNVFAASEREAPNGVPWFSFYKADRRVSCYYFYVWDAGFGEAFIKVCCYFPYPIKVWVNGHEWAKRQAATAGIGFTELSNGFAACDEPARLQAICDTLGPDQIEEFFESWCARLPLPLNGHDRAAGYWWELSMRQVEVSRTLVLDAPRRARAFIEALIADNLDLGRPDNVEIIFGRQVRRGRKRATPGTFMTTIGRDVTGVSMNIYYRHSRVKQYLKDGRALRIEAVINSPTDLGVARRLTHLPELQDRARAINTRILDAERVGQGTVLASPAFARVAQPTIADGGRRAPALRFGDPRVQALAGALCATVFAATGITHKSLRARVARLLGDPNYTSSQMSYDLRRLRLKGLIERVRGTNTYHLTSDGLRIAIFYTKIHNRMLAPLTAADQPPAPAELRHALTTIDTHIEAYRNKARLPTAA